MDNSIISSYTSDQAIDDGYLAKVFENRWAELSGGRPIHATNNIINNISMAGIIEIWNDYVNNAKTQEQKELFETKMDNRKVWVLADDGGTFTIMYPEDY